MQTRPLREPTPPPRPRLPPRSSHQRRQRLLPRRVRLRPRPAQRKTSTAGDNSEHLAIPDYDTLAAAHVVKRLDALTANELEAVRTYEAANRDRRTILHKIARLQATDS